MIVARSGGQLASGESELRSDRSDFLAGSRRVPGTWHPFAHRPLLDALDRIRDMDEALHEDARGMNVVGVDLARLHEVLDLGDRHLGS